MAWLSQCKTDTWCREAFLIRGFTALTIYKTNVPMVVWMPVVCPYVQSRS